MNPGFTEALLPRLRPGDLLIYSRNAFFSKAIKVKTWSNYSHVETFLGGHDGRRTHAARDSGKFWGAPKPGTGVSSNFEINFDGLVLVRRPKGAFDLAFAADYMARVEGQRYDVFGLLRFFTLGEQSTDKQFCSETATRLARAARHEPLVARLDADLVSPRDLAVTPAYLDIAVYSQVEHDMPPEQELV